jgi:flavin reductase (DIM6/NTAB) family NADH-FMN oxidoreductase RutF
VTRNSAPGFAHFSAKLDYPLYVATTSLRGEPTGCLIGFATQCSIHPARFLACLSRKNHTFRLAEHASALGVHVVEEKNKDIAELFGGETGDAVDKFARVRWHYEYGVPVLDDCERWFAGTILQRIDLGDHMGFLLEPLGSGSGAPSDQLTFQQARSMEPGHKP